MRIHRLEIQAFGPFADRQVIDFDQLGEHGLFLLNGPTGAGKTSVLDAICFALYGAVPGARQQARRLRSDHADPQTAPEIVCGFSSGTRRFEVVRSPQWERPAKRAGGRSTVTEQAKTLLREYVDGAWVEKSSRNDEASAEITELLGMNREQFTRVVMLPQGDFAAFLRADAASREQLLQQLFGTSRFEDIERRLKVDLAEATERFEAAQARSEHVLRRADDEIRRYRTEHNTEEAGSRAPGTGEDTPAMERPEEEIALFRAELDARAAAAGKELDELGIERERAERHLHELEHRRARGLALQQLIRDESEHRRAEAEIAPRRSALQVHGAAAAVEGPVRAADAAEQRTRTRRTASAAAMADLAEHALAEEYTSGPGLPDGLEARIGADLAAATAALEDERRIGELRLLARDEETTSAGLRERAETAASALESLRAEETALAGTAAELERMAADQERAGRDVARAEELTAAIAAYAAAQGRAGAAETAAAEARQDYQDLREAWQDLLQARLDQAAAELAAGLVEDAPCPVCGGVEHPHPATLADGEAAVTREAEQAAKAEAARAEAAFEAARLKAGAAAEEAAGLRARGGDGDAGQAAEQLAAAREELERARSAAGTLLETRRRLEAIGEELAATEAERSQALIQAAQGDSRADSAREQAAELEARVGAALHGFTGAGDRVQALTEFRRLAAAARETAAAADAAGEELDRLLQELEAALSGTGFASAAEVRAALLDSATRDSYERSVQEWEETGRRLALRREGQDASAPEDAEDSSAVPDEEDIAEAAEQAAGARKEQEDAALLVRLLESSAVRLAEYSAELAAALEETAPLRARRDLLQSVTDTVRGAGENTYKMTLSTYVLAARLEQVAAAATERLAAMTGGRYALVHSDSKSGNRKAGLGLHVTDEWTGQRRDTSTLSGGESFMASLALALGLADVVQQEAGGVNIETLFVDEGFGSLDDQSLEQVMDALEGLRDGGRVVGLVSHVGEMKQRIPAQLQILKGRNGSTIRYSLGEAALR